MCDVHVYLRSKENTQKIMESVEFLETKGSEITAKNIFGEEKTVRATFHLFDSSKNTVILDAVDE